MAFGPSSCFTRCFARGISLFSWFLAGNCSIFALYLSSNNVVKQGIISVVSVLVVSFACFFLWGELNYQAVALLLLLTVSVLAMVYDIIPVLLASALSAIIWNYCFIPPRFTLDVGSTADLLMFLSYFFVALLNGVLTAKIKQAERKARDREEKEKTIRLYNTLLNSLSHELRTPISTIIGAIDLMKRDERDLFSAHQQELLEEIEIATLRLNGQVGNLLDMSRLESGNLWLNLDWCDITELIYLTVRKIDRRTSHQISYQETETLPLFKVDSGLLEQVLHVLLDNAVCYTPDGTSVFIQAEPSPTGLSITIKDQGPGFPADKVDKVFEKFYRLPGSKTGGSGLGLSIAKGFVNAHGGEITLVNNKDRGSLFKINLPCEVSYLNQLKNE